MSHLITKSELEYERAVDRFRRHFGDLSFAELTTIEKMFPTTVRPDLETAIERLLVERAYAVTLSGISDSSRYQNLTFANIACERREPPIVGAVQYMDIDIGAEESGRCIISGVWMFTLNEGPAALLVSQHPPHDGPPGVRIEAIMSENAGGRRAGQILLARLAELLTIDSVYRGRPLSFETRHSYYGGLGALKVHRFPRITIDDVILPKKTLETLERTVFGFVSKRKELRNLGFSAKRGILLYGPPGTGKTHFIRYVLSQLTDHTSLIVTAEQVAFFDEIMIVARALQPSIVVIEDADLIARSREAANDACEEILLNKLLNQMDGLTDDAEIIFILTTNRPESLEDAIRNRPGRIDQAIEIPKPDSGNRARLLDLYRGKMAIDPPVFQKCVQRTEGVTASFIRELARRMAQFALLRGDGAVIAEQDMRLAFDDLFSSGSITASALGAE
jgi:hypothetical protein